MGKFYQQALKGFIEQLANEGERIVRECLEERDYQHRTKNLHDSYGYALYVYGEVERQYTPPAQAEKSKKWYGRDIQGHEEIEKFIKSYKTTHPIELVIVAAMPYAEVLENASSGQLRKYKVISMSYDKLKQLQRSSPLKTSVQRIVRGQLQ